MLTLSAVRDGLFYVAQMTLNVFILEKNNIIFFFRISFPEKMVHGVLIAIGVLSLPTYITCNIKYYSKRAGTEE